MSSVLRYLACQHPTRQTDCDAVSTVALRVDLCCFESAGVSRPDRVMFLRICYGRCAC